MRGHLFALQFLVAVYLYLCVLCLRFKLSTYEVYNDDRHVIKTFGNNDNENNINNTEFVTSTTVTTSSNAAYCANVCRYLDLCKCVIAWTNASVDFINCNAYLAI